MRRFLSLALLLLPLGAHAQAPVSATEVAAHVQGFYDRTDTIRTAFVQSYWDQVYQRSTRSRGVLTISKPGRVRFDYLGDNGQVIVSNGREMTYYQPGDGGGQYTRRAVQEEALGSALGLLTGQARLDRDFRFRLRDARPFSWNGWVLELRPRRADPAYQGILLFVDSSPSNVGVVKRIVIRDREGNINRFDLERSRYNAPVEASTFSFTVPRGARAI